MKKKTRGRSRISFLSCSRLPVSRIQRGNEKRQICSFEDRRVSLHLSLSFQELKDSPTSLPDFEALHNEISRILQDFSVPIEREEKEERLQTVRVMHFCPLPSGELWELIKGLLRMEGEECVRMDSGGGNHMGMGMDQSMG